ncbi:MAG: metallophosphoesterase family protein [Bacteroidales bacterium]|nr:metallophosphoesterase family protein [Bacteroidales bacterium]
MNIISKLAFILFFFSINLNAQIAPYLQSPTPTSIYISWHSNITSSTIVNYGTSKNLDKSVNGSYENIGGKTWHTVHLTDLEPNTEYFYSCQNGYTKSETFGFRTMYETGKSNGKHFVFIVVGDSRTDTVITSLISRKIEEKSIEIYGKDWYNYVNLMINVGDINTDGRNIDEYEDEFFLPFRNLTCHIPTMVSIGNHERESDFFYQYMKYEDLTGGSYPKGHEFNERFYHFEMANCQFISLNSNWQLRNNEQINWLDNVMLETSYNNNIDFVFPFFHHPGLSEVWPDGNTSYVQDHIYGVLNRYSKTETVFYGHSHCYEHGTLSTDALDSENEHDFHVVLCGGGGSGLDRWREYPNQTDYNDIFLAYDHYSWMLVDVDVENKSYTATTYSLGHKDKFLDNVVIDEFSRKAENPRPEKPTKLKFTDNTLIFDVNEKADIFSTEFQITSLPDDYVDPEIDVKRDIVNIFYDTGKDEYQAIDLNNGLDIFSLKLSNYDLMKGQVYAFRVRVRNKNMQWSKWSDEMVFFYDW